jgi:hypothetical protein
MNLKALPAISRDGCPPPGPGFAVVPARAASAIVEVLHPPMVAGREPETGIDQDAVRAWKLHHVFPGGLARPER